MTMEDAIRSRRSVRRFQPIPISPVLLTRLVDLARLHASGGNRQPLRYVIVTAAALRSFLFHHLRWAMYLPDFKIDESEQPMAYILLLHEGSRSCAFDVGAASTTIMLAAREHGLASCALASLDEESLRQVISLDPALHLDLTLALGYPAMDCRVAPMADSIQYWLDDGGCLQVPKRSLEEVLLARYDDQDQNEEPE